MKAFERRCRLRGAHTAATFGLIVVCVYADVTEQIRASAPYALRADGADAQSLRNGFVICGTIIFVKIMICIFNHNSQLNVGAICAERIWRRRSALFDCLARERTSAPYALRADGADVQDVNSESLSRIENDVEFWKY